jgi:ATP-dependent DNA helicase RecG
MAEQVEMDFGPPLPTLPQLWTPDDIFETCTAETIQAFKEDHRVERKPGSIKQNALADYVSMWANTQPHGGITLLGVADNGSIIGCKDRQIIPGAFIRVIRYEGTEEKFGSKLNVIADRVIDGPLPLQLAHAVQFITPLIRSFTRLGIDQRFETRPEFPDEAWSEAIVNAVVHRSYNLKSMNIFVKLFEDRLVVESPGAFLPPTTANTVFEAHNPRNPNTMWALYYFDFVQCAFEGTRRMRDTMRNANLPDPIFVQSSEGTFRVTVTLKNHVEHRRNCVRSEAAAGINPELYASLSESEKMIVNYLADNPRVNVTDAGRFIGLGWRSTKRVLDHLEKKGVIGRSGEYRSRHLFYFLKSRVHSK